jgi:hypothetical protein
MCICTCMVAFRFVYWYIHTYVDRNACSAYLYTPRYVHVYVNITQNGQFLHIVSTKNYNRFFKSFFKDWNLAWTVICKNFSWTKKLLRSSLNLFLKIPTKIALSLYANGNGSRPWHGGMGFSVVSSKCVTYICSVL